MMSFNFKPMSEEELEKVELIEKGTYDFEVIKSEKKLSKKGNNMCELMITIWDSSGKTHNIFDYLVFSDVPLNIKKVSHFCKSVGHPEWYEQGNVPEGLAGQSGKLELGTREAQQNPNGGMYPAKNIVIDYLKPTISHTKEVDGFKSDDIPF